LAFAIRNAANHAHIGAGQTCLIGIGIEETYGEQDQRSSSSGCIVFDRAAQNRLPILSVRRR